MVLPARRTAASRVADFFLSGTSPNGVTNSAIAYQTITLAQVIYTGY